MKVKKLIYGLAGVVFLASPSINYAGDIPSNDCFATVDYLGNTNDTIRLTHPSEALETNGTLHQVTVYVLALDGMVRGSFPINFVERQTVAMTMKQIFDMVGLNIYDGQARGNIIQLGTPADFLISGIVRHGLSVVPLIFQCHVVTLT